MTINTQLVTVTVDPAGQALEMKCLLTLGDYSQERAKTEYNCMSSNDSTVGLGSITRAPLELETLYIEDATDGQDLLKDAFDANANVTVNIEFDNAPAAGSTGTTLEGEFGVSRFVATFPKDGKIGANFTLEFMSEPTFSPAGEGGTKASGVFLITGEAVGDGAVGPQLSNVSYVVDTQEGDTVVITAQAITDLINGYSGYHSYTAVHDGAGSVTVEYVRAGAVGNTQQFIVDNPIPLESGAVCSITSPLSGGTDA